MGDDDKATSVIGISFIGNTYRGQEKKAHPQEIAEGCALLYDLARADPRAFRDLLEQIRAAATPPSGRRAGR